MKKYTIALACILSCVFIIALSAENINTTAIQETTAIAVAPTKMSVFYIGLDNPVEIATCGYAAKNITATIDNGSITQVGEGKFIVKVNSSTSTSTKVHVFVNTKGGATEIGERAFRVKRVPDPVPYIGGVKSGCISKTLFISAGAIIPKMDNFDFDLNFIVISYTFLIKRGADIIPIPVQGGTLTQQIKSLISSSPVGTRVYFEDIKAKGPDGSTRTLSPIILKII